MKYILLLIGLLIVVMIAPNIFYQWRMDRQIQKEMDASVEAMGQQIEEIDHNDQSGYVKVLKVAQRFTEQTLRDMVQAMSDNRWTYYEWDWYGVQTATASAMGIDRRHHFVNSYLVGYQPFKTDLVWVPLYTLAKRKRYQYDHLQYSGLQDVWQNSRQAYYYTRGDCEDHAMILADWLISMGHDARVVVGTYRSGGHAWVVCIADGNQYLLEATSKRKRRSLESIPLATMEPGYSPDYQFNRENFWVNTGSRFTMNYQGPHWKLRSTFVAANNRSTPQKSTP